MCINDGILQFKAEVYVPYEENSKVIWNLWQSKLITASARHSMKVVYYYPTTLLSDMNVNNHYLLPIAVVICFNHIIELRCTIQVQWFTFRQFVNNVFSSVTSIQFLWDGESSFHVMSENRYRVCYKQVPAITI